MSIHSQILSFLALDRVLSTIDDVNSVDLDQLRLVNIDFVF